MRAASPALIDFLANNNQFYRADLYEITLVGGYVMRLTGHDTALTFGGNTYQSWDIRRSRIRSAVGLEVDTMDIEITPATGATINGTPFMTALVRGALDSADVTLYTLVMPTPGDTSLGTVHRFAGRVADIDGDSRGAKLTCKSVVELLNAPFPPAVFQAGCLNTLYSAPCGVNKASRAITGAVTSSTVDWVAISSATVLTLGTIKFTSGANNGITRAIRAHGGGKVYFAVPLVAPCTAGDTFIAHPGCDKRLDTCGDKFANRANFRGFPFVPVPESML